MNLRNTALLFCLFLTTLWVFGFMLVTKQPAAEEGFLFPKLKTDPTIVIETVEVDDGKKGSFSFEGVKDNWRLKKGSLSSPVDANRVKTLIERIKAARHNPDAAPTAGLSELGLEPPKRTITLKGRPEKKGGLRGDAESWTLKLGNESPDKAVVYALSGDQPGKVFALNKNEVEPLMFDDPITLHSQLFFNFPPEEWAVKKIALDGPKGKLEIVHGDDGWKIETPPLGYADFEGRSPLGGILPHAKGLEGGVKNLMLAIRTLKVGGEDNFLPLGKDAPEFYGLDKNYALRIQVFSLDDKTKKETRKEAILIGSSVGKDQVYARWEDDPAVSKIDSAQLKLIFEMLGDPVRLRSRDLAIFQKELANKVVIEQGKEKVTLSKALGDPWRIQVGAGGERLADNETVDKLLETLRKSTVDSFEEEPKEAAKADAEMGFDSPQMVVRIEEMVLPHEDKDKKDAKDEKPRTTTLVFGKTERGQVLVKRTLHNGYVSRFQMASGILEKITGGDAALTYPNRTLPRNHPDGVIGFVVARAGASPIEVQRDTTSREEKWKLKDARESSGFAPADAAAVQRLMGRLNPLEFKASKWVKKLGAKEDLSVYGLDNPGATLTLSVRGLDRASVAGSIVALAPTFPATGLTSVAGAILQLEGGQPDTVIVRLGKDNGKEGPARGIYATHSQTDLLFVLSPDWLKLLHDGDYRDRSSLLALQPVIDVGLLTLATESRYLFNLASPLTGGRMHTFDPAKVMGVKLFLRTPVELRQFEFIRKDKTWLDQSNLAEFALDPEKVNRFLKDVAEVQASRIVLIGGALAEQKLTAKEATLRLELSFDDASTLSLLIGAEFEKLGRFAQTSVQPGFVFLVPDSAVATWLSGPALFAKDRVAAR